MGRPRKAEINQVVNVDGVWGVVVDYDPDREWGKYLVVRTDPIGRNPYGQAIWVHSTEFEAVDKYSTRPGRVYRQNQRLERKAGDRQCTCQCCEHENLIGKLSEPVE